MILTSCKCSRMRRAGVFFSTLALVFASAGLLSDPAVAQAWPAKPVRLIVNFPAGSSPDVLARALSAHWKKRLARAWWWKTAPAPAA